MKKILQIGALNGNLGDNIAVRNVQKSFLELDDSIQFELFNIHKFWEIQNNPKTVIDTINKINPDGVVVGGGGLIEYHSYESMLTKQKLPLDANIISKINAPVFIYGVGINLFRNRNSWPQESVKTVSEVFKFAKRASLRNDGSIEKGIKLGIDCLGVVEIPDPGLLHTPTVPYKKKLKAGFFQPAINANVGINKSRFLGFEKYIRSIPSKYNLPIFPHTVKDFNFTGKKVFDLETFRFLSKFENIEKAFDLYKKFDYIIAMRGHGQLVSIGMNIPGIYLSTQDKIYDFSSRNGFKDYTVDVREGDWIAKFELMVKRIQEDEQYIKEWYSIRDFNVAKWKEKDMLFAKSCIN